MENKKTEGSQDSRESYFAEKLRNSQSLSDIFEIVQEVVWKVLKLDQAGLLVGLSELGIGREGFLGAFYSPEANAIVMNKTIMKRLKQLADREVYNSYCFYILLHEYLHSCGFYNEEENKLIVAAVAAEVFGQAHFVTKLATSPELLLKIFSSTTGSFSVPDLRDYSEDSGDLGIEFVDRIDRRNTNYIM